jgi:hypothetical protein
LLDAAKDGCDDVVRTLSSRLVLSCRHREEARSVPLFSFRAGVTADCKTHETLYSQIGPSISFMRLSRALFVRHLTLLGPSERPRLVRT